MNRIAGRHVHAIFPEGGPVHVLLAGEAPGPRGADQSGIPFWGDRAGILVYRALATAGLADVPEEAYGIWDGARLRERGLAPLLKGAALTNALPVCPTSDGHSFRAPTDRELLDPSNLERLRDELAEAARRCPALLRVVALGRRAAWVMARVPGAVAMELHPLPHPSAQGLLQAAPGKGKGLKLADLQAEWEGRLAALLVFKG